MASGMNTGGSSASSFSAWFQEADKTAKSGGDPLKASGTASPFNMSAAAEYVPSWMKTWSQSDAQLDDLEAGGLLSRPSAAMNVESGGDEYALTRTERFRWFMSLLGLGILFFILAFFFLGMVLVMPGKFAFAFSLGSMSFMSAFVVLQGFRQWAAEVFTRERLPFTLTYFGSIFGTLFSTLYLRNYIAIVVFSVLQISSLGWYFATYVPGGKYGMRVISTFFKTTCNTCFKGCRLCIGV